MLGAFVVTRQRPRRRRLVLRPALWPPRREWL